MLPHAMRLSTCLASLSIKVALKYRIQAIMVHEGKRKFDA